MSLKYLTVKAGAHGGGGGSICPRKQGGIHQPLKSAHHLAHHKVTDK